MSNKKQVAKPEKAGSLADFADDFAKDKQLGGKVTAADLSLPFLRILQGLSPQLKRENPTFIKGAAIGDICLTVLGKLWPGDEGVEMIFCHYQRVMVEWRPLEQGGGIVNTYMPEDPFVRTCTKGDKGKMFTQSGNELIETAYHAVLVNVDGKWVSAVMPLKSTMLKISKKMNNLLTTFEVPDGNGLFAQAPRWAQRFKMTSTTESKQGFDWAVPVFTPLGLVDRETYLLGREWAIAANKSTNFAEAEGAQTAKGPVDEDAQF